MVLALRSCLYECVVAHERTSPKRHAFNYRLFMFCLDLDELDLLPGKLSLVRHNKLGLYSFYDADHTPRGAASLKTNVIAFLAQNGIEWRGESILLLTHLRVVGYVFNPVSFYFGVDAAGEPCWSIAEVENTFGEKKLYVVPVVDTKFGKRFQLVTTKNFYVSPFSELDAEFSFKLALPDDNLRLFINTVKAGKASIISSLIGFRRPLTDFQLLKLTLKFPLLTLRVILLIHWNAWRLYLKKVPFHRKEENLHLQKEYIQPLQSVRFGEKLK